MAVSKRLARLGAGGPRPTRSPACSGGPSGSDGDDVAAPPAAGSEPVGSPLDELRRRMQAILERPARTPPPIVESALESLPFQRVETDAGPLERRLERLRPSHHVGRMPVDAARAARAEVLALLALDPRLSGVELGRAVFFDTETTGLGGAGTVVFLFGALWFDPDGAAHLEQLLLRKPGDEPALLRRVAELFSEASLLVSFNGKAFDAPILAGRCVMNRLPPLPQRLHLDLLHVARRLHRARLGACRLTHLERDLLGFVRGEDVDGSDVPSRYSHFLRTGDEAALRVVVDHNAWDVVTMAALVGLYGEPVDTLPDADLVGLARTYQRAGALEAAARAAEVAVSRGGGDPALRARAAIAKARGDRAAALRDFATLANEVDDPRIRLELAKLYEHYAREPLRALELTLSGTGEPAVAEARRRERLERKVARQRREGTPPAGDVPPGGQPRGK